MIRTFKNQTAWSTNKKGVLWIWPYVVLSWIWYIKKVRGQFESAKMFNELNLLLQFYEYDPYKVRAHPINKDLYEYDLIL